MSLFKILTQKSPNRVFLSLVLGALAGLAYSFLIPLVLISLEAPSFELFREEDLKPYRAFFLEISNHKFALVFLLNCFFILFARTASKVILERVSRNATADLRIQLYKRITQLPIRDLEKLGDSKLLAILTTDVPRIIAGARFLPEVLINAVTLVGLLSYLIYLNVSVFYFVLGCIAFGIVTYQVPIFFGSLYLGRSRAYFDTLQEAMRGLISGAKELKLNNRKRDDFLKNILIHSEQEILVNDKRGHTIISTAVSYGDMISFFVIGVVTYILINYYSVNSNDLVGIVMALLYLTGPVAVLLNTLPFLTQARISLMRVNGLLSDMPVEDIEEKSYPKSSWNHIRFQDVVYDYHEKDANSEFQLGPVNLEIRKGEVTFIIGGNGSGKSTLSKLLSLHYHPTKGEICFDDTIVDRENRNFYRQDISAIYSDYYLFEKVLGVDEKEMDKTIGAYLEELGLKEKVKVVDGKFSTLSLSDGQKRRLALLVAFMEDRELYIFDEWAADQDPTFKNIFYNEILAQLCDKGKAVVVISHDDRYFDVADTVITMETGKVLRLERDRHKRK